MTQLKCKMCGGTLNIEQNKTVVECEFCGTKQTVPNIDNEKKINLHERANMLRLSCSFAKASMTYENIIEEFPNDAEAHWGLVLCRYGIEYIDDPKTKKKIPTCHRTQYKSIFDDIDYKAAIENSDVLSRKIYQEEAEMINKIQKKSSLYRLLFSYSFIKSIYSLIADSLINFFASKYILVESFTTQTPFKQKPVSVSIYTLNVASSPLSSSVKRYLLHFLLQTVTVLIYSNFV